ncbi:MAG: hypothetical protein ABI282_03260 [Candidatus Baltobacteraceae bacterium]
MNRDPDFELSADMRLLELQRSALGLAPHDRSAWDTRYTLEGPVLVEEDDGPAAAPGETAVLSVEASAMPASGVIPGAVVTFSLSIANEGARSARKIVVSTPLPGGASYRAGSFMQDGRSLPDEYAEHFFGAGLSIEELPAGSRASFVWKTGVRLGGKPLILAPQVRAEQGAVIGARPLAVPRKAQTKTAFTTELSRADEALYEPKPLIPVEIPAGNLPFYELDDEEQLVHEAADAALSAAAEKPQPVPPAAPAPDAQPAIAPLPEPAREAVMRFGTFDRTTLVFFERTFLGSKAPTILHHCIFANALACANEAGGGDAAGFKRHLDAQSQVLHRIVLHEKLGKKEPIAEYAGELLADLGTFKVEPVAMAAPSATRESLVLAAELSAPTLAVIARIGEEPGRWDFVKARQLTLALQAQRASVADRTESSAIEEALRLYAQASMTTLQKLFVRIRIDRTTGLLFAHEAALDAAARGVIAAFSSAIKR